MMDAILSASGSMTFHCVRLHRGDDLLLSIRALAREKNIRAGVVLSAVGCVSQAKVRDASGVANTARSSASTVPSAPSAAICTLPCPGRIFPLWAVTYAPDASSTPPVSWSSESCPAWPSAWSRTIKPGMTS